MSSKIYNIHSFIKKINFLKKKRKKIVLCHGVFDVLHFGHIKHFEDAKLKGDILVVSVTPDEFVNKGPNRPIFSLNVRMNTIAALEIVDFVIPNTKPDPINIIKKIKPNVYCKGKDYKNHKEDVTGKIISEVKAIKSVGGTIEYTNTALLSSSSIINAAGINMNSQQKKFINNLKKKTNSSDKKVFQTIDSFKKLKVLVIGETIIDKYVFCEALGKSGKEPVLVLRDLYEESYIGGAAALANNLSSFCKSISLLSNLGSKGEEQKFILNNLQKNIKSFFLKKKNSPTIIKKRYIDEINKTKTLGVYSLNDQPIDSAQEKIFEKKVLSSIKSSDLVIISDYGHGLISNNLAKLIIKKSKFLAVNCQVNASNIGYHVISKYKGADFITMNETELRHELRDKNTPVDKLVEIISNKLQSKYTNVTCGDQGAYIFNKFSKKISFCPAFANKVVDKVGTGDTMMTLTALSLFKKINIDFTMFLSAISAASNIAHLANKKFLKKVDTIKSLQAYLK